MEQHQPQQQEGGAVGPDPGATQQQLLQAAARRALPGVEQGGSANAPSSSPANAPVVPSISNSSSGVVAAPAVTVALPVWGPSAHLPGRRAGSAKNPFAGARAEGLGG